MVNASMANLTKSESNDNTEVSNGGSSNDDKQPIQTSKKKRDRTGHLDSSSRSRRENVESKKESMQPEMSEPKHGKKKKFSQLESDDEMGETDIRARLAEGAARAARSVNMTSKTPSTDPELSLENSKGSRGSNESLSFPLRGSRLTGPVSMKLEVGGEARADQSASTDSLSVSSVQLRENILLIGLPVLSFVLLACLIYFVLKCCLGCAGKSGRKHQTSGQDGRAKKAGAEVFRSHSPRCFMSGGKLFEDLKGTQKEDKRQFTINMEETSSNDDGDRAAISRYNPTWAKNLDNTSNGCSKSGFSSRSKGSSMSLDSRSTEPQLGRLKYNIDYDFNTSVLRVNVLEAEKLPAMDLCGSSDPYVKVYLLPDRRKYEKTKVHKKSLNPVFNETFEFPICYKDLMSRTILFMVFDYDRFSKHDIIGQVSIPVESLDLSETKDEWANLKRLNDTNGSQVSRF